MKQRISRRCFLSCSVASSLAIADLTFYGNDNVGRQPANVVLLMSDEHNPRYSSVYGHPFLHTPNLERLASQGVVFENACCPSPLCMPSRSAFVSGQRVHSIKCYSNCNVFPHDYMSYGEVLNQQGVRCVHLGKADVYRPARELGFSEVIHPEDRTPPGDTNISRVPLSIRSDGEKRSKGYGPTPDAWKYDRMLLDDAVSWLRCQGRTCQQPFTLAINLHAPHFPHFATPELWERCAQGANLPAYGPDQPSANHPYALDLRRHFQTDSFPEEDVRGLRRGYLACVLFIDEVVGALLDVLSETGLSENTVFIYTSDHGEMLGKFGMWWKCSLYEDSVRVPLIVAGPGFKPKQRVRVPVDLLDVQATLFAATQTKRPEDWVGTALQDLQSVSSDRVVFSEYHGHGVRGSGYVIRRGNWKLIWCAEAPHLLFDLQEDPEELRDLSKDKKDVFRDLETCLFEICDPMKENNRASAYIKSQLDAIAKAQSFSS